MEDHLSEEVAAVVTRVKDVLWDLPGPVHSPPREFFAVANLWKIEIPSTCRQSIEYVRGVMVLVDGGLDRPAAALSRSIHECYIRFEYLSAHEDQLVDWFRWKKKHEYHAARDTLRNFSDLSEESRQRLQQSIQDIKAILGETPGKRKYQWMPMTSMLRDVAGGFAPGDYGPMYRLLIADPSEYVHALGSSTPSPFGVIELTEISFALIIKRAMQLCTSKQLLGPSAAEIEALCDQILAEPV